MMLALMVLVKLYPYLRTNLVPSREIEEKKKEIVYLKSFALITQRIFFFFCKKENQTQKLNPSNKKTFRTELAKSASMLCPAYKITFFSSAFNYFPNTAIASIGYSILCASFGSSYPKTKKRNEELTMSTQMEFLFVKERN